MDTAGDVNADDERDAFRKELHDLGIAAHQRALAEYFLSEVGTPEVHVYFSTACLHGEHQHCGSRYNAYTMQAKKPAECKFCDAKCICVCHRKAEPVPADEPV